MIVLCQFLFFIIIWAVLYQYWIASYNLQKLVDFIEKQPGLLKNFDLENLELNHRKKSAFCLYLVAISVFFLYSIIEATSMLLFDKPNYSKSYLLGKAITILIIGILIWLAFAYKYIASITSIDKNVTILTSRLRTKNFEN